jgi:hypothetical protein
MVILIWLQHVSHKEDLKKLKNIPETDRQTRRHIERKTQLNLFRS